MKKRVYIIAAAMTVVIGFFFVRPYYAKYSKKKHIGTIKIGEHLYNEIYQVYAGGVLANDSYSDYLTDSVSFRKYIGTVHYDDENNYCKLIDSNTVLVYRLNIRNKKDTLEKKIYNISELKRKGEFE